jgi:hypothetical protein
MTKIFTISEEMLDSLASEYMTPEAAAIIVNKVKTQRTIRTSETSTFELKFAQARALKEISQWVVFADTPDQNLFPGEYSEHKEAWDAIFNKVLILQQRLFPKVDARRLKVFNDMVRKPLDEKDAEEAYWFDQLKTLSGE